MGSIPTVSTRIVNMHMNEFEKLFSMKVIEKDKEYIESKLKECENDPDKSEAFEFYMRLLCYLEVYKYNRDN